ncbi:hypothetical protein CERSUDRAFT_159676 [Gelatoporia subvermispora B]|uniref:Zn(2)-C6 fungal-type domain-containing protein n=1 Tax=Ceriporiopsis subvermispora (strain B) TaxID=914234 RepID=M2QPS4_CERS8|nr:hypothetical protein CERSUDRAFT_159676 [Gelatoporia subvermispora B]
MPQIQPHMRLSPAAPSSSDFSGASSAENSPYLPVDPGFDFGPYGLPATKRPRIPDDAGDTHDPEPDGAWDNEQHEKGEDVRPRTGACERCRSLKVRCDFADDPDTCRRCSRANAECRIPGRKKRKAPPKREILIKKIQEQASEIERLMAQLEAAQQRKAQPSDAPSPESDMHSGLGDVSTSDMGSPEPPSETMAAPDVQDWISKARDSFRAFGGYINMGGPSVTRAALGEDDREGSSESEHEYDDYEFVGPEERGGELTPAGVPDAGSPVDDEGGDAMHLGANLEGRRLRAQLSRESLASERRSQAGGESRLATIPGEDVPLGLMAHMSLKHKRRQTSEGPIALNEDNKVGVANENYFRASEWNPDPERPLIDQEQTPHILRSNLVTLGEVDKLFDIYFKYMNLSLSLLDPALYTAQQTFARSPFLFTVICAIASRHYSPRPTLYAEAMKYARLAAGTALIGGQKSVEVVQAYILLSLYPVPSQRWEEDRSWIYLGLAIRMAIDLNLHHPNIPDSQDERHAREMLNRTRTWLNCFNLDRSTGSQYGRPPIIDNLDYVANRSESWWQCSAYNMSNFDIQTCGYNAELRVIANFRSRIYSDPNHPTGLNKNINFAQIASETDDHLARLRETWMALIRLTDMEDIQNRFRTGLLKLAYSYARLTVLAVGFQQTFGKSGTPTDVSFLWRCLRAATDVVNCVVDDIGVPSQRIFLRHGPEAQSVFVTFACAFLVKLLQPKFTSYLSREQRLDIRHSVQRVIDLLGSPEVAIDDRHGPKLYARFLEGLLATPSARIDHSPAPVKREMSPLQQLSQPVHPPSPGRATQPTESMLFRQSLSPHLSPSVPASLATPPPYSQDFSTSGAVSSQPLVMPTSPTMDFSYAPLGFDQDFVQSMQSLTDPNGWLPGFNWMGTMDTDTFMRLDQTVPGVGSSA